MTSIRKAPRSARWEVRYRDLAGRQRTETFDRKGDAQARRSALEVSINRGSLVDPTGGRTLLSDWVDEWWATTTNLRPSTRARDESYIRNHVLTRFGTAQLGRITQLDVRAWVADPDGRGLAPATVVKAYQILGKILDAGVDGGLIPTSPCHRVPLPKIERQEMRFLTPEEIGRLAGSIDPRYRAFVLLKAYGGFRLSEMAALRRGRVGHDAEHGAGRRAGRRGPGPHVLRAAEDQCRPPDGAPPRQVGDELVEHPARYSEPTETGLVFPGPGGGPLRAGPWRQRFWRPATHRGLGRSPQAT